MPCGVVFKTVAVWLGILVLAVANGMLRESLLIPELGPPRALILSGALLSGLILVVTYFALPWFGRRSGSEYLVIGLIWLCLTLAFEFAFGRMVLNRPWSQIFEAYMFRGGNIWPLVLAVTALAPYLAARVRGRA